MTGHHREFILWIPRDEGITSHQDVAELCREAQLAVERWCLAAPCVHEWKPDRFGSANDVCFRCWAVRPARAAAKGKDVL